MWTKWFCWDLPYVEGIAYCKKRNQNGSNDQLVSLSTLRLIASLPAWLFPLSVTTTVKFNASSPLRSRYGHAINIILQQAGNGPGRAKPQQVTVNVLTVWAIAMVAILMAECQAAVWDYLSFAAASVAMPFFNRPVSIWPAVPQPLWLSSPQYPPARSEEICVSV